jgi:pimeloyl-ACP methyl ester carboxylesterase
MPTITVENHQLNYVTAGNPQNPPIVMLHGWGSYHGVWKNSMEALQNTHYCIAIDHLGFGHSDKPAKADYSIRAQARRALKLMDELGLSQFSIMGHSMGGQIGMIMASELAPERITSLVNVGGVVTGRLSGYARHVVFPTVKLGHLIPSAYILPNLLLNNKLYARYLHGSWFYKMNSIPFENWETDRKMARQKDCAHSIYWAGIAIATCNLVELLPKISAETLIIFGKHDGTVPIGDGELAHQHIPNNKIIWIDDCGHFPMYEKPTTYLEAITQLFGTS